MTNRDMMNVAICRDLSRFGPFRKLVSAWKGGSDGSGLAPRDACPGGVNFHRISSRAEAPSTHVGYARPDRRDTMYPYTTKHRETSCCTARIGLPCMDMSVAMLPFMSMKNSHPAALFLASR